MRPGRSGRRAQAFCRVPGTVRHTAVPSAQEIAGLAEPPVEEGWAAAQAEPTGALRCSAALAGSPLSARALWLHQYLSLRNTHPGALHREVTRLHRALHTILE